MLVRWPGRLRSPAWVLTASLLLTVVLAIAANLTLELVQLTADAKAGGHLRDRGSSLSDHPSLFWLGTLVVWLMILLVLAVTGRLWVTIAVTVLVVVSLGYANYVKLALRLEPIYPSDLVMTREVDFLSAMVGPRVVGSGVAVLLLLVGVGLVGGRLANKFFPRVRYRAHPRLAVGLLALRVCLIALILPALASMTQFNSRGNAFRAGYEQLGAHWKHFDQRTNYQVNGFVGGMLYNTDVRGMVAPDGYSSSAMSELVQRYAASAARINRTRDPDALAEVNVVMVLSESFTDPLRLDGVEVAEDPIPFTRSLMRRTTSGLMLASRFGGGTANMEFSALTGMSMSQFEPQMTTPYQQLVPDYDSFPSFLRSLEGTGHRTVAIHPFLPSLYRRSEVYPILGFDTASFAADMQHTGTIEDNPFISDESAFSEVEEHIKSSEDPVFINLVTMQNHYPMAGKYADPIDVSGIEDKQRAADAEGYLRGLRYSDEALRGFIESLEDSDEKTILLLYGDHLPPFWPQQVLDANGLRVNRETPFFIYANFGQDKARQLPTTSPIHFANHILERADAPVSPFHALLAELEREVPAMEQRIKIGADNRAIPEGGLSQRARELLRDYRLVQYDLSVGKRYAEDQLLTPTPPQRLS